MRHLILALALILASGCASAGRTSQDQIDSTYALNSATTLDESNIRVTAGGQLLKAGIDYTVNLEEGTVSVINPAYLKPGVAIEIEY